jgi:hypothetical protein
LKQKEKRKISVTDEDTVLKGVIIIVRGESDYHDEINNIIIESLSPSSTNITKKNLPLEEVPLDGTSSFLSRS